MPRATIAIVGAGKAGLALARMLSATGDYVVRVGDCTEEACSKAANFGIDAFHLDATSPTQLAGFLDNADIAVGAVPDRIVARVQSAALEIGCHYVDFSMPTSVAVDRGGQKILCGCGISPGIADLVVESLASQAVEPVDIALSVGAIPVCRTNRLGYSMIWNFDGLFSEYTSPCEAIENFVLVKLDPLARLQQLIIEETQYEAFTTAGVIGPVSGMAHGNIRTLVCRTIRYPGHLDYVEFLLDDLRLRQRRDMLASLLQNGLASTGDDKVLIHATAATDGSPSRTVTIRIDRPNELGTALATGSAAHAAWLIDGLAAPETGPCEIGNALQAFLESRYAKQIGVVCIQT